MITSVIITVKIAGAQPQYDMELPANVPMKELFPKLLMALKSVSPTLFVGVEYIRVRIAENNRYLADEETLESAGIWDGSIITVERRD